MFPVDLPKRFPLLGLLTVLTVSCNSANDPEKTSEVLPPLAITAVVQEPAGAVEPNSQTSFVVTVKNQSRQLLQKVSPALECGCQLEQGLPEELAPDGEYLLKFWVKAPSIGSQSHLIPLKAESGEALAQIPLSVNTAATAPRLFFYPKSLHFRLLPEAPKPLDFSLVTIESAELPPTLQAEFTTVSESAWKVTPVKTEDKPTGDPGHVYRHYDYQIALPESLSGQSSETLRLGYTGQDQVHIPVVAEVLAPVSLAPASLLFHPSENGGRIRCFHLISRIATIHSVSFQGNHQALFEIRELLKHQQPRSRQFEVTLKSGGDPALQELDLEIRTGEQEPYQLLTLRLPVMFLPSAP